jgi:hypothetical protein
MIAATGWRDDPSGYVNNDGLGRACRSFTTEDHSINCWLLVCFPRETYSEVRYASLSTWYDMGKDACEPLDAGSRVPGQIELDHLRVRNDPDFSREVLQQVALSYEVKDGVVHTTIPYDIIEELDRNDTFAETPGTSEKAKRQGDDDRWISVNSATSITNPSERYQASGRLSGGVQQTWSFSETTTVGISTTVEMGVGWEIFTASVGITTSYEHSETVESGLTFTVECDEAEEGVVWYYPLFNWYEGFWASDPNENIEVWIPRGGDNDFVQGRFVTECLGRR